MDGNGSYNRQLWKLQLPKVRGWLRKIFIKSNNNNLRVSGRKPSHQIMKLKNRGPSNHTGFNHVNSTAGKMFINFQRGNPSPKNSITYIIYHPSKQKMSNEKKLKKLQPTGPRRYPKTKAVGNISCVSHVLGWYHIASLCWRVGIFPTFRVLHPLFIGFCNTVIPTNAQTFEQNPLHRTRRGSSKSPFLVASGAWMLQALFGNFWWTYGPKEMNQFD